MNEKLSNRLDILLLNPLYHSINSYWNCIYDQGLDQGIQLYYSGKLHISQT